MDNVTLIRVIYGQRYANPGDFRHSRSGGACHSDLQNEEESTEIDSDTAPRAQSESMHEKAPPPWRYFRLREGQGFFLRVGSGAFYAPACLCKTHACCANSIWKAAL